MFVAYFYCPSVVTFNQIHIVKYTFFLTEVVYLSVLFKSMNFIQVIMSNWSGFLHVWGPAFQDFLCSLHWIRRKKKKHSSEFPSILSFKVIGIFRSSLLHIFLWIPHFVFVPENDTLASVFHPSSGFYSLTDTQMNSIPLPPSYMYIKR